jgi:hypothetical protein
VHAEQKLKAIFVGKSAANISEQQHKRKSCSGNELEITTINTTLTSQTALNKYFGDEGVQTGFRSP